MHPFRKTGPLRIRSRATLIALTVLLQAAVIGLGWLASLHLARADVSARARDRFMEEVSRGVEQFNEQLAKVTAGPLRYSGTGWEAAQSLVETYKMPRGASLVLIDRFGHIVCHPGLRKNPNLRSIDYSDVVITLHPSGEKVSVAGITPGTILTGDTDLLNGNASVAVMYNPTAETRIVAHQSAEAIAALESRLTGGFTIWGAAAGLCVLGVTLLGSIMLVRRYDSILERANERLEHEVERRTQQGLAIRNGVIFGLAKLADSRDSDTGRHLERICQYSEILAEHLLGVHPEIDRPWIERLKLASSMHDIGKVGIPDAILLKPGPFTPEERRLMELHPIIGADTLAAIRQRVGDDDLINMGIQVALSHHERYDGRGYPYRLEGEQIPLAARIVALADVYDALTSARVYKPSLSHAEAAALIRDSRGSHLDPLVVDAFVQAERQFDEARRQLHAGEVTLAPASHAERSAA
ncbi:MAG TPA: HD domain-containing phosphohydrolase [Phycisphaerales bacterium]|nr:HD domain-containing phosphohydrolase [Phycisphaerales bacterium]